MLICGTHGSAIAQPCCCRFCGTCIFVRTFPEVNDRLCLKLYRTRTKYWIYVSAASGLVGIFCRSVGTGSMFIVVQCLVLLQYQSCQVLRYQGWAIALPFFFGSLPSKIDRKFLNFPSMAAQLLSHVWHTVSASRHCCSSAILALSIKFSCQLCSVYWKHYLRF